VTYRSGTAQVAMKSSLLVGIGARIPLIRPLRVSNLVISGANRRFWTDHFIQHQQFSARHPQVGQREQRLQLRRVLDQAPIADLHVPELLLDHAKRVFHLGTDAGLDLLDLLSALPPARIDSA
jgi:hypothetical protein